MIRFAVDEDLKYCEILEKESFMEPWDESSIRKLLTSEFYHVVVAVSGEDIIGYALYSNVFGSMELMRIAVSKNMRRMGIGDRLLKFIFNEEKKRELFEVFLEVRTGNLPAKNLYEKNGFRKFSTRKNYYSNGEDADIYRLNIDNERS